MAFIIDANMKYFANRINITSSRLEGYGRSTIDEIIEAETSRGNTAAVSFAQKEYDNPDKLIRLFRLADPENKFRIIDNMDDKTKTEILPLLMQEDLVMGLHFFTSEKLLKMLINVNPEELIRVVREAFSLEQIVMLLKEEDLEKFFLHKDLDRKDVMQQIKLMPIDLLKGFIEGVTGKRMEEVGLDKFMNQLDQLNDEKFKKFMSQIDPDVQRQLTFQLTKDEPKYMTLFDNMAYLEVMNTLLKPDIIKSMFFLEKETLVNMMMELTPGLMAIVGAQIDTRKFADFLLKGHIELLKKAAVS